MRMFVCLFVTPVIGCAPAQGVTSTLAEAHNPLPHDLQRIIDLDNGWTCELVVYCGNLHHTKCENVGL